MSQAAASALEDFRNFLRDLDLSAPGEEYALFARMLREFVERDGVAPTILSFHGTTADANIESILAQNFDLAPYGEERRRMFEPYGHIGRNASGVCI